MVRRKRCHEWIAKSKPAKFVWKVEEVIRNGVYGSETLSEHNTQVVGDAGHSRINKEIILDLLKGRNDNFGVLATQASGG